MKKKEVLIIIAIIIAIVLITVFLAKINMDTNATAYDQFDFTNIDLATTGDGIYKGSEDSGIVKASVEVTVEDHMITQIEIVSHDYGKGKPAEVIVDEIVKQNSIDVDAISGATTSSNIIKMAVFNALDK